MIVVFVVFLSQFLYFSPYPEIYSKIDPFLQYAILLVYPLYYIYFRLLTVDPGFSFKKHGWVFLAPTLLFILYVFCVARIPSDVYIDWLYYRVTPSDVLGIKYLNIIDTIIQIVFILQVLFTLAENSRLIHKYRKKAEQYYSNIGDSGIKMILMLNVTLLITAINSLVLKLLERYFVPENIIALTITSATFSAMLFIIGWLGLQQKSMNPTFESEIKDMEINYDNLSAGNRQLILEKIICLFKCDKLYLNNRLTINDVAQSVGTNRTYISSIINQKFNQNFCSFVNNYRIEELEKVLKKHPEFTNQVLAETSGFGSIASLKRAIYSKTRLSISEWKDGQFRSIERQY
ncbi:MAG: hypothetical protein PHS30_09400 [Bacteroidales bacterium]|nr:hypothetical protein [Bacteroidales bacterium]